MGSNWSQLKKHIQKGDEQKSLELYNRYGEIRKKLNANAVVNELTLDTYMHLCAKNGMLKFLKLLLYENNGNPNVLNRYNQNVLHKCCEGTVDTVQYECMQIILQWRGQSNATAAASLDYASEININEKDQVREEYVFNLTRIILLFHIINYFSLRIHRYIMRP